MVASPLHINIVSSWLTSHLEIVGALDTEARLLVFELILVILNTYIGVSMSIIL